MAGKRNENYNPPGDIVRVGPSKKQITKSVCNVAQINLSSNHEFNRTLPTNTSTPSTGHHLSLGNTKCFLVYSFYRMIPKEQLYIKYDVYAHFS